MPRDANDTRERLITAGERLFASRGVYQVTVREINEAAKQRNTSAIHYHFGSREGLLDAILMRPQEALDAHRGQLLAELRSEGRDRDPFALVMAMLIPLSVCLHTTSGRDYLRIVAQLVDRFPQWREELDLNPPNQKAVLHQTERQIPASVPRTVKRERMVNIMILMMAAIANRARQMEEGDDMFLDDATFLDNLADMIVGALMAEPTKRAAVRRSKR